MLGPQCVKGLLLRAYLVLFFQIPPRQLEVRVFLTVTPQSANPQLLQLGYWLHNWNKDTVALITFRDCIIKKHKHLLAFSIIIKH